MAARTVKWPLHRRIGAIDFRMAGLPTIETQPLSRMLRYILLRELPRESRLISAIVPLSNGGSSIISLPRLGVGPWDAYQWAVLPNSEEKHLPLSAAAQVSIPMMIDLASRSDGGLFKGVKQDEVERRGATLSAARERGVERRRRRQRRGATASTAREREEEVEEVPNARLQTSGV